MWAQLKKLTKDCLTENDNKTYCPFRVAGAMLTSAGLPTFISGVGYNVIHNHAFDMTAFGMAFGAMMSGVAFLAGGVAAKARTDRDHNE
jgi:hypothetical protein